MSNKKDYIEKISECFYDAPVFIDKTAIKKILRKLVRESVNVSWHRAEDESVSDLANRIAKDLVP